MNFNWQLSPVQLTFRLHKTNMSILQTKNDTERQTQDDCTGSKLTDGQPNR